MGRARDIIVKVIPSKLANDFIKKHHYSGKVVPNSQLHFGAFLDGRLHGVLSYGPSMDKRKVITLVEDTGWNEFLELNRMAFDDYLPRNSESFCIGKTIRMIKKQAPHIKWIISFADGTQCGDGTIYRASNFVLTDIKENNNLCVLPNGQKIHKLSLTAHQTQKRAELGGRSLAEISNGSASVTEYKRITGAKVMKGYQLRYIYFIDKSCKDKLTVPIIPFTKIDEIGAGMYKGENISREERHNIKSNSQLDNI